MSSEDEFEIIPMPIRMENENLKKVEEEKSDYYWENQESNAELPKKIWHWTYWAGEKAFQGMEFSGEVLAEFFGLTRSKYQWIVDMKERQEFEKAQQALEDRQRRYLQLQTILAHEKEKLIQMEQNS